MPTSFKVFRILAFVTAALALLQAISAGVLLSSVPAGRAVHGISAMLLALAAITQLVTAAVARRGGAPKVWLGSSVGLVVAVLIQFGAGMTKTRWIHVPLGVLIWGAVLMTLTGVLAYHRSRKAETANPTVATA